MLLQIKNCHFWMKAKIGQRGAALVEYAVLLAFVAIVAAAFISGDTTNGTIAGNAKAIIDKINGLLNTAATNSGAK